MSNKLKIKISPSSLSSKVGMDYCKKFKNQEFEDTILLTYRCYEEDAFVTELVTTLDQIELLKLKRLWLLAKTTNFSEEHKKIIHEEQEALLLKLRTIKNFQQRAEQEFPILDWYVSGALPIQYEGEEGVYSHTRMEFDHTKTFARIEVARRMIELATRAIVLCANMKEYSLEEKLNRQDVYEIVTDIQAKLLVLQEVFIFGNPPREVGGTGWGREVRELNRRYDELLDGELIDEFETIRLYLEMTEAPKQHIFNILTRTKKISVLSSNAVVSSYLFRCLEGELRAQLEIFIKQTKLGRKRESIRLESHLQQQLDIGGVVPEFELEVYDENRKVKRNITVLNLLEMLQNERDENSLFQQEQRVRELVGNNHELRYFFSAEKETETNGVKMPEFYGYSTISGEKEGENSTKEFKQKINLSLQKIEELEQQSENDKQQPIEELEDNKEADNKEQQSENDKQQSPGTLLEEIEKIEERLNNLSEKLKELKETKSKSPKTLDTFIFGGIFGGIVGVFSYFFDLVRKRFST